MGFTEGKHQNWWHGYYERYYIKPNIDIKNIIETKKKNITETETTIYRKGACKVGG